MTLIHSIQNYQINIPKHLTLSCYINSLASNTHKIANLVDLALEAFEDLIISLQTEASIWKLISFPTTQVRQHADTPDSIGGKAPAFHVTALVDPGLILSTMYYPLALPGVTQAEPGTASEHCRHPQTYIERLPG